MDMSNKIPTAQAGNDSSLEPDMEQRAPPTSRAHQPLQAKNRRLRTAGRPRGCEGGAWEALSRHSESLSRHLYSPKVKVTREVRVRWEGGSPLPFFVLTFPRITCGYGP